MNHSARPTVQPVAITILTWSLFCFAIFWKVGTDVQTPRVKLVITTFRDYESASWINYITVPTLNLFFDNGLFVAAVLPLAPVSPVLTEVGNGGSPAAAPVAAGDEEVEELFSLPWDSFLMLGSHFL